jgi:hypothetical protein
LANRFSPRARSTAGLGGELGDGEAVRRGGQDQWRSQRTLLASGQTVDAKRKGIGLAPVSMIVGGPLISAGH